MPVTPGTTKLASGPRWYGRLHERLSSGQFVVTAEIPPPHGASAEAFRRSARALRSWIDAANVTDGQGARVHLPSWAGALVLLQEGVEPIMQLQCRDRNRIALQADLLGAGAMQVPNVLLLTGDPPGAGDDPDAKPVFELGSLQLIEAARTMRDEARLLSGRKLSHPPRWLIGAAEDPFAGSPELAAQRLLKKATAGARFIQTQFVFDLDGFGRWLDAVRGVGVHEQCRIIAGVGPIRSLRSLHFLSQELPGVHVPDEVVSRLRGVPEDRVPAEGVAICAETIQRLRELPGVAGVHVMASRVEEFLPDLLTRAGVGPGRDH